MTDADAQRKKDAATSVADTREEKRVEEARKHMERLAKVAEKKDAKALSDLRAGQRTVMLSLLKQWTVPMMPLGLLCYILGRVFPAYITLVSIGGVGIGTAHSIYVWVEAPVAIVKAKAKQG